MIGAVLFKVKKDKINIWREWSEQLEIHRRSEALETIIEEREIFEGSFDFKISDEDFVLMFGYNEEELLPATEKEINTNHKRIKRECLEFISKVNNNYFLFNKEFNKS